MPTQNFKSSVVGVLALSLTLTCFTGCGDNPADVKPNLDENDPRLIESDEVINFVPEGMSKEDAALYN